LVDGVKGIKGGENLKPKIKLLLIFRIEGKCYPGIVKSSRPFLNLSLHPRVKSIRVDNKAHPV
jgi:hypothetical protein